MPSKSGSPGTGANETQASKASPSSGGDDMASGVDKEVQALKNDLGSLRKDVGELAEALRRTGGKKAAEARRTVEDELDHVIDEIRGRSRNAAAAVEKEVSDRPLTTILAAFGIGFVLGKVFDRG